VRGLIGWPKTGRAWRVVLGGNASDIGSVLLPADFRLPGGNGAIQSSVKLFCVASEAMSGTFCIRTNRHAVQASDVRSTLSPPSSGLLVAALHFDGHFMCSRETRQWAKEERTRTAATDSVWFHMPNAQLCMCAFLPYCGQD
jgi:hypothetical protein